MREVATTFYIFRAWLFIARALLHCLQTEHQQEDAFWNIVIFLKLL